MFGGVLNTPLFTVQFEHVSTCIAFAKYFSLNHLYKEEVCVKKNLDKTPEQIRIF